MKFSLLQLLRSQTYKPRTPAPNSPARAASVRTILLNLLFDPALDRVRTSQENSRLPIVQLVTAVKMPPNQDPSSQSEQSTSPSSAKIISGQAHDEDGFVDIHHEDVEMPDNDPDAAVPSSRPASESLELQRLSHSDRAEEEDDSEDDDRDIMTNHPLLSMLSGRLGQRRRGSSHKWDRLHPENQTLSVIDVDQCSSLEEEAFPPEERASREKVCGSALSDPSTLLGVVNQVLSYTANNISFPVPISTYQMSRIKLRIVYSAHKGRAEGFFNTT